MESVPIRGSLAEEKKLSEIAKEWKFVSARPAPCLERLSRSGAGVGKGYQAGGTLRV